jgi:hypothetical protein
VDLAAADDAHHLVAGLLHLQGALDELPVVLGELDRARVTEEVGRVEQEDVERVALDPLTAVEETTERADLRADVHPARVFHRVHARGLVRDRADPTDPGGDVGGLGEVAAPQQRLEEARRLVDAQLDVDRLAVADLDQHRALALDAGEIVGPERSRPSHRVSSPP